jgi:phosphoglycolate phosphatase-like HAD superfamily hydrolase
MRAVIFDLDDTLFSAEHAVYDGAHELLAILRRLGVRIGALTSGDHRILVRLEEAGLSRHFDYVLCTEHTAYPKDGEGVHLLLQRLGAAAEHAVLVSHAHDDILLGKRAGLYKTIGVSHGPADVADRLREVGADHVVPNIPAVLDVLE